MHLLRSASCSSVLFLLSFLLFSSFPLLFSSLFLYLTFGVIFRHALRSSLLYLGTVWVKLLLKTTITTFWFSFSSLETDVSSALISTSFSSFCPFSIHYYLDRLSLLSSNMLRVMSWFLLYSVLLLLFSKVGLNCSIFLLDFRSLVFALFVRFFITNIFCKNFNSIITSRVFRTIKTFKTFIIIV
jgi:hypothetical protein